MLPGDWRSMRPVVDRAKCVKCAVCWLYCPVQCVVEKPAWFDIDYATCKGCGICATECPHRAISDDRGGRMSGSDHGDGPAAASDKPDFIVCDGNEAAALGGRAGDVDMVAVYPITPQSSLVEYLAKLVADGELDAEIVDAEGEHSVLSVLQGAALAGARTYTATCGPGLAFMFEPYLRTPGLRLPMVMSIVTRDTLTPQSVWGGHQDAMIGARGRLGADVLRDGAGSARHDHHGATGSPSTAT